MKLPELTRMNPLLYVLGVIVNPPDGILYQRNHYRCSENQHQCGCLNYDYCPIHMRYFILLFTSVPAPVPLYLLWAVLKLYLIENFILWVSIRLV